MREACCDEQDYWGQDAEPYLYLYWGQDATALQCLFLVRDSCAQCVGTGAHGSSSWHYFGQTSSSDFRPEVHVLARSEERRPIALQGRSVCSCGQAAHYQGSSSAAACKVGVFAAAALVIDTDTVSSGMPCRSDPHHQGSSATATRKAGSFAATAPTVAPPKEWPATARRAKSNLPAAATTRTQLVGFRIGLGGHRWSSKQPVHSQAGHAE